MVINRQRDRFQVGAFFISALMAGCGGGSSSNQETLPGARADIVIRNARIIDGTGQVIESGTVVVQGDRIETVAGGESAITGSVEIDARGMSVLPGLIDAHRHLVDSEPGTWLENDAPSRMSDLLNAGFTTVLSCGDPVAEVVELRRRLSSGEIPGPRLYVSGVVPLSAGMPLGAGGGDPARAPSSWAPRTRPSPALSPEQLQQIIQSYADAGVDAFKTILMVTPGGPEQSALRQVVAEGDKRGILTITHAVTVDDTLAAVGAGVDILVHTPIDKVLSDENVKTIAASGIPTMSTLGVFLPVLTADNRVLFRDGLEFPWQYLEYGGHSLVNARLLRNAGVTYGFGTDVQYGKDWTLDESIAHELKALSVMFSPQEIVSIITRDAAATIGRGNELGTLEAGKVADILVVEGNPLQSTQSLQDVRIVIKSGKVVVDKRS